MLNRDLLKSNVKVFLLGLIVNWCVQKKKKMNDLVLAKYNTYE